MNKSEKGLIDRLMIDRLKKNYPELNGKNKRLHLSIDGAGMGGGCPQEKRFIGAPKQRFTVNKPSQYKYLYSHKFSMRYRMLTPTEMLHFFMPDFKIFVSCLQC